MSAGYISPFLLAFEECGRVQIYVRSGLQYLFIRAQSMTEHKYIELTRRAFELGFRQGYEIANRTTIDKNTRKDAFGNTVLQTAINSLESTVFETISAELDRMSEKYPAFDSWKVFSDGVIHGAVENYLDRTGNEE
jgi:hypothetical protein